MEILLLSTIQRSINDMQEISSYLKDQLVLDFSWWQCGLSLHCFIFASSLSKINWDEPLLLVPWHSQPIPELQWQFGFCKQESCSCFCIQSMQKNFCSMLPFLECWHLLWHFLRSRASSLEHIPIPDILNYSLREWNLV